MVAAIRTVTRIDNRLKARHLFSMTQGAETGPWDNYPLAARYPGSVKKAPSSVDQGMVHP